MSVCLVALWLGLGALGVPSEPQRPDRAIANIDGDAPSYPVSRLRRP